MALTKDELYDLDPIETPYVARSVALRHAWNAAVAAEAEPNEDTAKTCAAISQAWSAIAAEVLK